MFHTSIPGPFKIKGLSVFENQAPKAEPTQTNQKQDPVNPFALRQLWISHLLHERDELQKTQLTRQPLNSFFRTIVFSPDDRDDRSIH